MASPSHTFGCLELHMLAGLACAERIFCFETENVSRPRLQVAHAATIALHRGVDIPPFLSERPVLQGITADAVEFGKVGQRPADADRVFFQV